MKTACYVLFISACHTAGRTIKAQQRPSSSLHHHSGRVYFWLLLFIFYRKLLVVPHNNNVTFEFTGVFHFFLASGTIVSDAQSSSDCTGNRNNIIIVNFPLLDFVVFIHFSILFYYNFLKSGTCCWGSFRSLVQFDSFIKTKNKNTRWWTGRWVRVERTFFFPVSTNSSRNVCVEEKEKKKSYPCVVWKLFLFRAFLRWRE